MPPCATPILLPAKRGGGAERSEAEGGNAAITTRSRRKPGTTERARDTALGRERRRRAAVAGTEGPQARRPSLHPPASDRPLLRRLLPAARRSSSSKSTARQHADSAHDRRRDEFMRSHGFSILRFWNTDVLKHRTSVCETILAALDGRLAENISAFDLRFVYASPPTSPHRATDACLDHPDSILNNGPILMKSHVKAVVIGGGVVGCSVLYHLAKAGWTDIMLIERSELTSGSSWHAAGGFHTLNGDPNVAKLQAYTVQLYKELEELSGQSCSLHLTGGVMLADSARAHGLPAARARQGPLSRHGHRADHAVRSQGDVPASWTRAISSAPCGTRSKAISTRPARRIAYSKAAKKLGAEIVLRNPVKELTQEPDGTWNVVTEQGTVQGRARGQLRRPVGARDRPHGRRRAAGAGHGAHVPAHRADAGGRGLQQGDRPRDGRRARLQGRDLHAPGAQRHPARHL